jgi:hypothetical protein
MTWHRFVLLVGFVSVVGCASGPAALTAGGTAALAPSEVARLQKPEHEAARDVQSASYDTSKEAYVVPPGAEVASRVRATVNGVAILDGEVRSACYGLLLQTRRLPEAEQARAQKEILEQTLQRIIEREIILDFALNQLKNRPQILDKLKEAASKEFDKNVQSLKTRNKLKTDDELKQVLQNEGMSLEAMRRQQEREFMKMEYVRSRIFPIVEQEVNHEAIVEYYQEHAREFETPERIQWQDIFVAASKHPDRIAARRFAESIVAKARAGTEWIKLSEQYDDGDSAYRRGEGFGQQRGEIKPPEVEPVLLLMQPGQLALVEVANGFHVIRLVKHEFTGHTPLDEKTQAAIKRKLQEEVGEREYKRILADLKRRTQVYIDTDTP